MAKQLHEHKIAIPKAILVHVDFADDVISVDEQVNELRLLASSAEIQTAEIVTTKRSRPDPALFIGTGKAEEIKMLATSLEAEVVIFNHALSPIHQRNLEKACGVKIIDRIGLILDIFGMRAKSYEGKLQVELAQLEYQTTRLVKSWSHLERQRGGIGLRGGPGETQLEIDRRLLRERMKMLKGKLEKLSKQRESQRRSRERNRMMTISLVGYTNAGKSTLFNKLSNSKVYAADQLFATLDTTSRRIYLPSIGSEIILSDTVGFIRQLPHSLVEAFKATLEETIHADLLLHVIDSASSERDNQISEVNKVLHEIKADSVPQIMVFNKIDLLDNISEPLVKRNEKGDISEIWLSAEKNIGLDILREVISDWYPKIIKKTEVNHYPL